MVASGATCTILPLKRELRVELHHCPPCLSAVFCDLNGLSRQWLTALTGGSHQNRNMSGRRPISSSSRQSSFTIAETASAHSELQSRAPPQDVSMGSLGTGYLVGALSALALKVSEAPRGDVHITMAA